MEHRCCKRVPTKGMGFFYQHQCTRKGKVERDGKWYCKQHDPEAVKARKDARRAKWDAEWEAKLRRDAIQEATLKLAEVAEKWVDGEAYPEQIHEAAKKLKELRDG